MKEIAPTSTRSNCLSFIFWWAMTIIVLVLMDDFVFGPFFWWIALISQPVAAVVAFLMSLGFQLALVSQILRPTKSWAGSILRRLLKRLQMPGRSHEVNERREQLKNGTTSAIVALLLSPIIGGVLPILYLDKKGVATRPQLQRLAYVTTAIYAIEFALIHGGYGLGAVLRWMV